MSQPRTSSATSSDISAAGKTRRRYRTAQEAFVEIQAPVPPSHASSQPWDMELELGQGHPGLSVWFFLIFLERLLTL
ncbi:MAG TPA: hypothetical protein VIC26_10500 [Marinagarivorans sp.]